MVCVNNFGLKVIYYCNGIIHINLYTVLLNAQLIVVAHPNMVKTVLTGNYVSFPKANMYNRFKFLLGNGLVTSGGIDKTDNHISTVQD